MVALWIIAGAALLLSVAADRSRTRAALERGARMLAGLAPLLVALLAAASLLLGLLTPELLAAALSGGGPLPFFGALLIGAVALVPGFVAYPLAGVLSDQGASVATLAAFITALMMVGVLTLPVEARYFGWRLSILRNALAMFGALAVAAAMAWILA